MDIVDEETPTRLVRQGGQRLLRAMMGVFLDRWDERVEQLHAALDAEDAVEAARLAHSLRGSCLLVGLPRLGDVCASVEREAEAEDLVSAKALARGIPPAFEEARPWILKHAGR